VSRCSICLDGLGEDRPIRRVLMCGHLFHSECLLDWIKLKESCPNCKKQFDKKAIGDFEKKQADGPVSEKSKLKDAPALPRPGSAQRLGAGDPRESAALLLSDLSRPAQLAPTPLVRISRPSLLPPPVGPAPSAPHQASTAALGEAAPGRSRARLPSAASLSRGLPARHLPRPSVLEPSSAVRPPPAHQPAQPVQPEQPRRASRELEEITIG
jgi:hypothetical protein